MRTISEEVQDEIIVKKSRFLATLRPVRDKEEAEQFIARMKKTYWDARHNCSAYILPAEQGSGVYVHSSDDGEPASTAGKPMLAVLEGADLIGVCAVVTRYFGGILLGTGGLVRAYQDAVSAALSRARLLEQVTALEVTAEVDYTLVGKLQNFLSANPDVLGSEPEYGEKAVFHLYFEVSRADRLKKELIELTNGKIRLETGQEQLRLLPVSDR